MSLSTFVKELLSFFTKQSKSGPKIETKELNLVLVREIITKKSTIGVLYYGEEKKPECYTLEDHDRLSAGGEKIAGETAIPKGRYRLSITHSPRFNTRLPLVEDVPGFSGVRIHPGNTAEDTEGCILVGEERGQDAVLRSRSAFKKLFKKLDEAIKQGYSVHLRIM